MDTRRTTSKEELIGRLGALRSRLSLELQDFKGQYDPAAGIKRSLGKHSVGWIGAAALGGLLLVLFRPKKPKAQKTLVVSAAKSVGLFSAAQAALLFLAPIVRPLLVDFVKNNLRNRSRR